MTEFESANFIILIRVSLCWTNRVAAALELELDRRFGHRTTPIRHKMNDCAFAEVLLAKVSKWHFGQSNQSCEWANEKAASKYHLGNLPKKFQNCRESNFIENCRRLNWRNFLFDFNLRIFVSIYAVKYILLISTNLKPCLNLFEPMRWERKFSNFQHLLLLPFSKDSIQHRLLIGRNENVGWCRREVQLFEQPIAERHFLHLNFDWFISFPHSDWLANKNSRTLHGIETFLRHRITSEKQGGGHKTDDDCSIFVNVELFGLESVDAKIKCCRPM